MQRRRNPRAATEPIDQTDAEDTPEYSFSLFTETREIQHTDIYLSAHVAERESCDKLCNFIRKAGTDDTINLFLNSDGGDIASGLALISAMRESEATITTILNTQAISMGAVIFLSGDKKVAPPHSILMFHTYSSTLYGKGSEQIAEVTATADWYAQILRDVCDGFLKKAEIKAIIDGKDLWLRDVDINNRLANLAAK